MKGDKRNARVLAVAEIATYITAANVTQAVEQLRGERIRALDGPDRGETAGRSTSSTSDTERNANEAYRLGLLIEDLRDAIEGFEIAHRHLAQLAAQGIRTRAFGAPPEAPPEITVCKHNQHGKQGVIEWGDPNCDRAPVKAGLCAREYMRYYRWCIEHGVDRSKDFAA